MKPLRFLKNAVTSSTAAWRDVSSVMVIPKVRVWTLAGLGAAVGICETILLAVIASVGVALAGKEEATLKLPFGARLSGASTPTLLWIGAAAGLASLGAQILIAIGTSRITARTNTSLRKGTYADFVATSWRVQRTEMQGTFLSYIVNYIPRVSNVLTSLVTEISAGITLVIFLVAAVATSPVISLVVIAAGTVTFSGFLPVRAMSRRAGQESTAATRVLYSSFVDAVGASREIKTYGVEDQLYERIAREVDELEAPAYKARLLQSIVPAVYARAVFFILLGGMAAVYSLHVTEFSAIGAAMLFVLRAMQQAQTIQGQEQVIAESRPWIGELKARRALFLENVLEAGDEPLPTVDTITFENVGYTYDDGTVALDGVTFDAKKGELVGVIGPSGSGKSTLSELIVRLDKPSTGSFKVNGKEAMSFDQETWAQQVVLVPQLSQLLATSVEENIRFLRQDVTRAAVENAAARAHLTNEINELDDGFDTEIGERGHRGLSGGQRQRLSIARAIARMPSLVVLDEPTSALDHEAEEVIVETIEELRKHACVVVIAHRLSTLRHCDRVLVLRDGKQEAFCPLDDLADESAFFRAAAPTKEF
jgi:ABC-type multidrug transport system fused ATPase/permease subunit